MLALDGGAALTPDSEAGLPLGGPGGWLLFRADLGKRMEDPTVWP